MVAGKRTAQLLGAWVAFEDEAGQDLKPGKGRTWSRQGRTPLVKVTGKGSGRVMMAGMICVRPGRETRLIYRTQTYRGRTGEKKGFRAREFADLLTSARRQLGGAPLIVVWDNASTHHAKALREFCERNSDWLTIVKLPPYAPDLNPVEGVWAHLKRSLANLAPRTIDDLTPLVEKRLRDIQRRPKVLDGFIAETGLGVQHASSPQQPELHRSFDRPRRGRRRFARRVTEEPGGVSLQTEPRPGTAPMRVGDACGTAPRRADPSPEGDPVYPQPPSVTRPHPNFVRLHG
ncbi:IS630 family transposase [Streptomyces sp. NPDC006854]|uniref:IS630 family transposase n=1 Tax=unclassified Streptomyces TaxID=2593676 RepID=UPI0033EC86B4